MSEPCDIPGVRKLVETEVGARGWKRKGDSYFLVTENVLEIGSGNSCALCP